ncbi:hypothetical protein ETU37_18630 [Nocardioides iriomotensis]|uniref:Uncharacterized protein n=1 Tax=Nocardioides iriomotensis TaxID=715784 RepID=A0A4Q5IY22_9ACTN|nr:hypothetical protein ETU37_18630 [Nocardioides iriomotensis]
MQPFVSGRISVDGEDFDVTASEDHPGQHHLTWASGPNPGYGFTCRRSDGQFSTEAQLVEQIRDFLASINSTTGYLD